MSTFQARESPGVVVRRTWPSHATNAAMGAAALVFACHAEPTNTAAAAPGESVRAAGEPRTALVEVVSCVDLPRDDPRSHDLSGLAWDPADNLLYAISDREPWLVILAPAPDLSAYAFRPTIPLDLPVERWDGEALAFTEDRLLVVADETEQAVFSVDRAGNGATRVALPVFPATRHNRGMEGLGYARSANGRYIFAVNEQALEGDGPTSTISHGTVVRLLRHALDGGGDVEVAYLTDPVFATGAKGDNGVSDIAPLSPERVLVLERAWVQGRGNGIRLYEVDLRTAPSVLELPDARAAEPVRKRLVVDLAQLPDQRCAPPSQWQRRRTLENYEGMALGPTLRDGRRILFLISDDNSHLTQDARVLALALAPAAL
jgi:hypothetical protein